jgi:hypothetical protein
MTSVKLSVTIRKRLLAKYGVSGVKTIDSALAAWSAANARFGFRTVQVALDDPRGLARFGVRPLKGNATAAKVKRVVDDLWEALKPDYLVLIGSGDVVPFFEVVNPSARQDDEPTLLTDNPYGCSTKFSARRRRSYLVPDRVVGRIPDLPGAKSPAALVDYLVKASAWEPRPASLYRGAYAVCCDAWRRAGHDAMRKIGESADEVLISPPATDASAAARRRLRARLHMIKCHGADLDVRFYGQKGESYPEILTSATLPGRVRRGTVVGAMCCFGAQVFSPEDPAALLRGVPPIATTYLRQGAAGFAGATSTAWVGFADLQCIDWIVTGYLKNVMEGSSLGRAVLDSKQGFFDYLANQGRGPDRTEEKSLLHFILLGDPAIHPVSAAAPGGVRASAAVVATGIGSRSALQERRARRATRASRASRLRDELPERLTAGAAALKRARSLFAFLRAQLGVNAKRLGVSGSRVAVDRTVSGVMKTYDYYWAGRKRVAGRRHYHVIRLETDDRGRPLRARVVVSG